MQYIKSVETLVEINDQLMEANSSSNIWCHSVFIRMTLMMTSMPSSSPDQMLSSMRSQPPPYEDGRTGWGGWSGRVPREAGGGGGEQEMASVGEEVANIKKLTF